MKDILTLVRNIRSGRGIKRADLKDVNSMFEEYRGKENALVADRIYEHLDDLAREESMSEEVRDIVLGLKDLLTTMFQEEDFKNESTSKDTFSFKLDSGLAEVYIDVGRLGVHYVGTSPHALIDLRFPEKTHSNKALAESRSRFIVRKNYDTDKYKANFWTITKESELMSQEKLAEIPEDERRTIEMNLEDIVTKNRDEGETEDPIIIGRVLQGIHEKLKTRIDLHHRLKK